MDLSWTRLKTATQAGMTRIAAAEMKSSASLTRRASRVLLPYQLASTWRRLWSKMFRNDGWHRHIEKAGLIPTLVGADLHLLSDDDKSTLKFLVLVVPRKSDRVTLAMELFFRSLTSHTYDASLDQVTFSDWNLVVNVASLRASGTVVLEKPTRVFSRDQPLTLTVLSYEAEAQLRDMRPGFFGGLCRGLPRSTNDIQDVFSVMLKGGGGKTIYQKFERPGCPPVQDIMATYLGEEIGPWRFATNHCDMGNC
ncbi:hypothetical protein B0T10DRAFT_464296 [Thelonectria olida]|uniref:Uncharacterized protein n=1 Tax=Thelonectria olida TaxID=1576542 RepID=A0A9P8VUH4_9HYPO|nr:hypothetical protein B0T10DRAFT_464296 [Thelonectria olida]